MAAIPSIKPVAYVATVPKDPLKSIERKTGKQVDNVRAPSISLTGWHSNP